MINRRTVLGSLAATPVLALPSRASAAMVESPLFPPVTDRAFAMRARVVSRTTTAGLSPFEIAQSYSGDESVRQPERIERVIERVEPTLPVRDVIAAEEFVFRNVEMGHAYHGVLEPQRAGSCVGDRNPWVAIVINRASNLIAARSRIGVGNIAFMHEDHLQYLARPNYLAPHDGRVVGRWRSAGTIANSIEVMVSSTMTRDKVVVARAGIPIESPVHLINTPEGLMLGIHDSTANLFASFEIKA